MKERIIDYDNILKEVKNQLITIMEEDYSYYKNYKFIISSEQQFIKDEDLVPNNIFIVVRFLPATVHMGQIVLPMTITAMSEQNKLKVCQTLFNDLSQSYNLKTSVDKKTRFIYESPRVFSNFTSVGDGFRSLIQVAATFVVSENANFFTVKYYDNDKNGVKNIQCDVAKIEVVDEKKLLQKLTERKNYVFLFLTGTGWKVGVEGSSFENVAANNDELLSNFGIMIDYYEEEQEEPENEESFTIEIGRKFVEEIPIITTDFNFNNSLDTQPFFHTNNIANSVTKYGTFNISFVLYLLSDVKLANDILNEICKASDDAEQTEEQESKFYFKVEFESGHKLSNYFRLANANGKMNIGDIPMINLTFSL